MPCHTRQFTGNQFQVISMKKRHSQFNVHIFFSGIIRHWLKNYFCATKVVLLHALQLVASKLPVKVASCDKALKLCQEVFSHFDSGLQKNKKQFWSCKYFEPQALRSCGLFAQI